MRIEKSAFCFVMSLPLLFCAQSVSAEEIQGKAIWESHPSVIEIEPGIFMRPTDNGARVVAHGVAGMEFTLTKLDEIIESKTLSQGDLRKAIASRDALEDAISIALSKDPLDSAPHARGGGASNPSPLASDNGTICQTVSYDLTASANEGRFWYVGSSATAGFQQWGGGPPSPYSVTLYTFASASGNGYTQSEYDAQTFSANGFAYVTADPSSAQAGPSGQCMEAQALSYVDVPGCPGTSFKSVYESVERYCD